MPYPGLDSTLWQSSFRVPPLARVIAFGAEDGYLAAVDSAGSPLRIDFRLGTVSKPPAAAGQMVSSFDGGAIYTLLDNGSITRSTPSGGDWSFSPPLPAHAVFAQEDGSLIVAGAQDDRALVWRVRPPGQVITDSLSFDIGGPPEALRGVLAKTAGSVGDRVFFGAFESVIAVRSREMQQALNVEMGDPVRAVVATPSGDRLFVALTEDNALQIVDRFTEEVTGRIKLPSAARALRMDPLGRLLLAQGNADTVFVISLGSDAVQGVVRSAWRADLPLVFPDGAIATTRGDDVLLLHPTTLAELRAISGGALDFWHAMRWNGFRPRAAGLDQPVQFRASAPRDPVEAADVDAARRDTTVSDGDSLAPPPIAQYTVSFAAVLDEKQAKVVAGRIRVDGNAPRITTSDRAGKTLYRVVLGPFPTRAEAERVGKASGQSYWTFEGAP